MAEQDQVKQAATSKAPSEQRTDTVRRARPRAQRPTVKASANGNTPQGDATPQPILPEEVIDSATTSAREAAVEPATPGVIARGGGISPENTIFVSLCFEGPDIYSMAGDSARALPSSPNRWRIWATRPT